MTVGQRIKARRLELSLTQEELAKKIGYKSKSSINKIELTRNLPFHKIVEFSQALECSPSYLLGWDDCDGIPLLFSSDLAVEDVKLLNIYHQLTDPHKEVIFAMAKELLKSQDDNK